MAGRSLGLEARTEGPLQVLLGSPLSTSFEPLKQVQGQQPGSFCTLAGLHTCPPHRTPQPGVLARPTRPLNRRALPTHPHLVSTPWHPALPFAFLCAAEISNVSNLCYLPAANVQAFFFKFKLQNLILDLQERQLPVLIHGPSATQRPGRPCRWKGTCEARGHPAPETLPRPSAHSSERPPPTPTRLPPWEQPWGTPAGRQPRRPCWPRRHPGKTG